jgi:exodeoxyribonuclease-5
MSTPTLTPEQATVAESIISDIERETPVTTLGGLAGTGKSVLIAHLVHKLRGSGIKCAVITPTGKAADVLQRKGIADAQTIHSFIYRCERNDDDTFTFYKRTRDEIASLADALIIDEASMVNRELFDDLSSFGLPALYVGDHGQLEPIGDSPNLMENPRYRLETVHRQAADSPIIRFAHALRTGETPLNFSLKNKNTPALSIHDKDSDEAAGVMGDISFTTPTQLICALNRTRVSLNEEIRRDMNFTDPLPLPGDRIICLRNNKDAGLFNGMCGTVLSKRIGTLPFTCDVLWDGRPKPQPTSLLGSTFNTEKIPPNIYLPTKNTIIADYAYAITCHKAQGSQFDRCIVYEDFLPSVWSQARWRYTAATRAASHLSYLF